MTLRKTENRFTVARLTNLCLALILLCSVSLVFVFVRNFHLISSNFSEMSIRENNSRLRDNVHLYLREYESVLLSARAGVSSYMSQQPVDLKRLQRYLEEASHAAEDISILHCTTNEVWNRPGGFAVFSQPWDIPHDWDNTDRPWFLAAKRTQGRRVAYSKPYLNAITGDIILDISISVNDEIGNDIGVVSASITIEALNAMLGRVASLEGQRVYLVDIDGAFVVHPDKEMVARGNFFNEAGLEGYSNHILYADQFPVTDKDMTVYSSSIPGTGWFVVSIIPTRQIYSSINAQILSMFLTPMLKIFFMLLVVLISLLIIIRRESKDKLAAERETREKDYFIARMSHEIRTPMNAVIGMSELAQQDYGTLRGLEHISGIKNAGASLLTIINDILDFTKIESGRLELIAAPYDTASMLNDVLTIIRVQIAQRPLKLIVESAPDIPRGLIGDAVRVKQVLLNLLGNAVKYTDTGQVRLSIHASKEEAAGVVRLTFVVEDSGIGIKPEDMPKLFSDFSRIDEKRNSAIEGTGLGLSISRNLCKLMEGDIGASSEYGKGSVFTATMVQTVADWAPMGDVTAVSAAQTAAQRASFIAPEAEVLVVDDIPNNLLVAEGLLRPYKMRVFTCLSGREAIELVKARSFDLVLMDHMMPEMDGMGTMHAIRALGGRFVELPIVALTAHAVNGMKEMFLEGGFDDFLSKPIETDKLDELLLRWIKTEKQQNVQEGESLFDPAPMTGKAGITGAIQAEWAAQQLDMLNHYRWHFENGLPVDEEYFKKFSVLTEAMGMTDLAELGRRGDTEEIRRLLPDAYEALVEAASRIPARANTMDAPPTQLKDTLSRLKTALDKGDEESAYTVMRELRAMTDLSAPAMELYFFLCDTLLMGETEKAAGGLSVWMNIFRRAA